MNPWLQATGFKWLDFKAIVSILRVPSPGFTSAKKDQGTPSLTNKHAEAEVDDSDNSETSNTEDEDECSSDKQASTDRREVETDGASNSSTYDDTVDNTEVELYSIQPVRSKRLFEENGNVGPIYKGRMFRDKKTLKGALGMNALTQRFEYKVRRSNHTRFVTICKKRDRQWVFRAWKSRNGTYWNVMFFDSEHTCCDNGNYNVDFHRVSSHVIGQMFSRKFVDPGRNIYPKDIMADIRDKHGINLSYNKA
ncbi:hypothetical protein Dsin_008337 [Dipteronia sinensis]|uniref:Transposase MuDR plant domain-containing protein n=1 Tax=Dipteronia sinensis TaxID=43782 RepID=A0AAE0ANS1_9ROSI|nr:hypothetical protein Dsin_008337 [Dipteronia sinensis]